MEIAEKIPERKFLIEMSERELKAVATICHLSSTTGKRTKTEDTVGSDLYCGICDVLNKIHGSGGWSW
jgi:hypothetical protein